jgi:hypothetical protein
MKKPLQLIVFLGATVFVAVAFSDPPKIPEKWPVIDPCRDMGRCPEKGGPYVPPKEDPKPPPPKETPPPKPK